MKRFSRSLFSRHAAVAAWIFFLALCIFVVSRVQVGADLSAFLPRTPTPAQQLLSEQLRDGVFSRLILIGIEGGTPDALSAASKQLAQQLRNEKQFSLVNNGDENSLAKDQSFLLENRYLLSSAVTPEHFTPGGLHAELENSLQLLGSPAGFMVKQLIPRDPSGELLHLLEGFSGQSQPSAHNGVWVSHDGRRALLLAQTRAPGFDIDAQQKTIALIHTRFAEITRAAEFSGLRLVMSGPGVFSVHARDHIKDVAFIFSVITSILVSILLLLVYRSWRVLALSLLPVASGALAGIAAVSVGYGVVYGVTLGFGITLIGEAVDYAIFFFTRLAPGKPPNMALDRIWPTLRLGVMTTICGFSPMFLANFPGFAQLGLFSVVGLIVAVLVTRWVLPSLVPDNFSTITPARLSARLMDLIRQAPRMRPVVLAAVLVAVLSIVFHRGPAWSDSLSSLSPLLEEDKRLDESLRHDIGAPDVGYMVIVGGNSREDALVNSEALGAQLDILVNSHALSGYDTPARYLPSDKAQRARLAALPAAEKLQANLRQSLAGLPFRANLFAPFLSDVANARKHPLLAPDDLRGTNLGLQTESLLVQRGNGWAAILPLRGVTDITTVQRAITRQGGNIVLLDLQRESNLLYQTYVDEAIKLSSFGALAIILLLLINLRSVRRVAMVLLPLAAAVIITTAIVLASGQKLLIFHLIGLLLAVAVGSNYSLFFDRESYSGQDDDSNRRTMLSLLVANISTSIAFGMLGFSGVPLLAAIGETVALGAFLSLLFSAVLMGQKAVR